MAKSMTPQQIAEKQIRRGQAAVNDWKAGVQAVKESPTAKAAKAVDAWFQGLQKSYNDGSYVDGLNAVSKEEWIQRTIDKGGATYGPGLQKAQSLIEEFHTQNMANQATINSELESMPRGSLEANIARMVHNATRKAQFKFRRRRR